jgi:hypothetical protein
VKGANNLEKTKLFVADFDLSCELNLNLTAVLSTKKYAPYEYNGMNTNYD